MLLLTTYRSSWGQLLHFENLVVLHLLILAVAPAADAWSLDARRTGGRRRDPTTYGLALQLACLCVVTTYVIAGIAKLRLGGLEWALGDTLRNHIAYSAVRLDLLGGSGSPFAGVVVRNAWILPPVAALSVLIELAAPMALVGPRLRNVWVAAAWSMHRRDPRDHARRIPVSAVPGRVHPVLRPRTTGDALARAGCDSHEGVDSNDDGYQPLMSTDPTAQVEALGDGTATPARPSQRQSAQRPYTSMMWPVARNPAASAISPNDASSVCSNRGASVTSCTRPHSLQIRW